MLKQSFYRFISVKLAKQLHIYKEFEKCQKNDNIFPAEKSAYDNIKILHRTYKDFQFENYDQKVIDKKFITYLESKGIATNSDVFLSEYDDFMLWKRKRMRFSARASAPANVT